MKRPKAIEITSQEAEGLLDRLLSDALSDSDKTIISIVLNCYCWLQNSLKEAKISLHRVKTFFGIRTTEKKNKLSKEGSNDQSGGGDSSDPEGQTPKEGQTSSRGRTKERSKEKSKGHGRLGHKAYWGAKNVHKPHETLKPGDRCPEGCGGCLYSLKDRIVVALKGHSIVSAIKYFLANMRCSSCGKTFTATAPKKYDESVKSIIALAKTYLAIPFNRIAMVQGITGVPLPNATQWDLMNSLKEDILPVYSVLEDLAAQGELIHHDDTPVKILDVIEENRGKTKKERTGMYTSGIYAKVKDHIIALFKSGTKHSGENMTELLKKRKKESGTLMRMADALTSNLKVSISTEFREILSHCLAHARRKFYEIYEYFPGFCGKVIDDLAHIYTHDAIAKEKGMSPEERLKYHQEHSGPIMEELKTWMETQLQEKRVEDNSSLGKAFYYMLKRWDKFTVFLRTPGAPLDNNIVEGMLKIPIRARKNSLFYKTEYGALVGSILTSVIHTCVLAGENPLDYLIELQKNAGAVAQSPSDWLPWTYRQTLGQISPRVENQGLSVQRAA